jgi:hypothetical protein
MSADIRRRFISKEAFFSPDFPAPDQGNGFAVQPDTGNPAPSFPSYCLPAELLTAKLSDGGSVPNHGIEMNSRRFDKPFAFCGTPSMNDTGCENEWEHRAMS